MAAHAFWWLTCLLLVWRFVTCVEAQSCQDEWFWVNTTRDAEALRECREIDGNVVIKLGESANLDISGVEVIHGTLAAWVTTHGDSLNLSSTTLTRVGGDLKPQGGGLQNISFPKLETVGGIFEMWRTLNLVYLDITALHSIESTFYINAPRLSTLRHNELRYVGGKEGHRAYDITVAACDLESVDSLFNNNIKVKKAAVYGCPRLKRVVVGFNETESLQFDGIPDNGDLEVILGGDKTTSMKIGDLWLTSVNNFRRNPRLKNLDVNEFTTYKNNITHLHLPFDQLQRFRIQNEANLVGISNVPQAMNWRNFSISTRFTKSITLASTNKTDENGTTVRSWYWPQKDMFDIDIGSHNVSNSFL